MGLFIEGADRRQATLLPNTIEDYVGEENLVRVIDAFIDMAEFRSAWLQRRHTRSDGATELSPGDAARRDLNLLEAVSVAIDGNKFKAVNHREKNFTHDRLARRMVATEGTIDRYLPARLRFCRRFGRGWIATTRNPHLPPVLQPRGRGRATILHGRGLSGGLAAARGSHASRQARSGPASDWSSRRNRSLRDRRSGGLLADRPDDRFFCMNSANGTRALPTHPHCQFAPKN